MSDPIQDFVDSVGNFARSLLDVAIRDIREATPKPNPFTQEPPEPEPEVKEPEFQPGDHVVSMAQHKMLQVSYASLNEHHETLRQAKKSLEARVAVQKLRLQTALDLFHGVDSRSHSPFDELPLEQVVDTAVRTLDGGLQPIGGFPKHIVPDADRVIEALRAQVAELEAQQAADVKALARQAREIDALNEKLRGALEAMEIRETL